MPQGNK